MVRWLLALLTLVALGTSGMHMPAMASASDQHVATASTTDCHASMAVDAAADKPATPSCCPEGKCDGQCSPVAAFFSGAARSALSLLRAAIEAPALAAAPSSAPHGIKRPPRFRS